MVCVCVTLPLRLLITSINNVLDRKRQAWFDGHALSVALTTIFCMYPGPLNDMLPVSCHPEQ